MEASTLESTDGRRLHEGSPWAESQNKESKIEYTTTHRAW